MRMGRPAVFLDRDGVINQERGDHTWRLDDFTILPGVAEALRSLAYTGHLLVVVSNQSGIGLGNYTVEDVERLHGYLHDHLAREGVRLTDVYYCPHHPSRGRCLCRKPGSLMLERAIARHGIDAHRSVLIGDRERDIEAARAAGVKGILVSSNQVLMPVLHQAGLLSA